MAYVSPIERKTNDNHTILIRTADVNDGLSMHELTKEVINEEDGLIMVHQDFTMTVEDQRIKNDWYLQLPQTLTLLAEHEKKLIGILTIEPGIFVKTAHRGNLGLIIRKDYRSKGIGRIMMHDALAWAKKNNVFEKIELEVLETNKKAIALYEKLNFKVEGIIKNAVKQSNNNYVNLYQMGLPIK
ncbi:GNAT family N-acetyltransferase [Evansella sp. AB-P1]|uniref:GNAT family N-acetyltransferase n=1 Tax=Evansella sp. AB-P1 TaxID=3037653 RepID=UPI00241C605C|nr:GNAT family N-acetyltransferase [Evansella sp. AB-P1]MDG5789203.1 GNAT family N-acetyltransferase [Evansella sp. AB-P1]